MTALAMNGDKERCIEAGMDGYLSKPIRPQELDDVLDGYMALKDADQPQGESAIPAESPVDVAQLLDRIDGDRALLAELVDLFRAEFPGSLRAAQQAISQQDCNALRMAGHTLKGALANLSATKASTLAGELEAIGKSLDLTGAQATLDSLAHEIIHLMRALEALCPTHAQ
jgi:HPt (histidine-containing phosphotransfer) domain-containing protein